MQRGLLYLILFLCPVMGNGCGPECGTDGDCAVGAYCTAAATCETKACQPSAGSTLGPDGFVRFCRCVGDVLEWETGNDQGACTFGCELTWTAAMKDCTTGGLKCEERAGDSERPVVGCF